MAIPSPIRSLFPLAALARDGDLARFRQSFRQHDVVHFTNPPEAGRVIQVFLRQVIQSLSLSQQVYAQEVLDWWRWDRHDGNFAAAMVLDRICLQTGVTTFWIDHKTPKAAA